jgi:hypothetical protein
MLDEQIAALVRRLRDRARPVCASAVDLKHVLRQVYPDDASLLDRRPLVAVPTPLSWHIDAVRASTPSLTIQLNSRDWRFADLKKIVVVMPAYNAVNTLQRTHDEIPLHTLGSRIQGRGALQGDIYF